MEDLSLSLIENAKDFLKESVKYTKAGTPRDQKYVLLNLASGLELMMKAILEREHWSLIFQKVDEASWENLEQGEFKSVDFRTALHRLATIAGIKLPEEDGKYLNEIRRLRNRILHFDVQLNLEKTRSILAQGLNTVLDLYKLWLGSNTTDDFLSWLIHELEEFEKFVELRLEKIRPNLESAERPPAESQRCPSCFRPTLVLHGSRSKCLFCEEEFGSCWQECRVCRQEFWSTHYQDACDNCIAEWGGSWV